jgi:hypothetical protein
MRAQKGAVPLRGQKHFRKMREGQLPFLYREGNDMLGRVQYDLKEALKLVWESVFDPIEQ